MGPRSAPRLTLLVAILALGLVVHPMAAQRTGQTVIDGWVDPAPHTTTFVTVARGVRLETLDFGGTGQPLVLLAGIGNTAHAYDDFAERFTDRYHVVAITRRGFGMSSHPEGGYDVPTLARDIKTVLDSLHLNQVFMAGHSFAGQEMTYFVHAYPGRVTKLVYLDGAYDNTAVDSVAQLTFPNGVIYPTKPALTEADTATPAAYVAYVHADRGIPIPESDIRMRLHYDGAVEENARPYTQIENSAAERPNWKKLTTPALAIFAVLDSVSQTEPWIRAQHSYHDAVQDYLNKDRRVWMFAVADFQHAPHGTALVIHGGHHWIFVSHKDVVVKAMRDFLAAR